MKSSRPTHVGLLSLSKNMFFDRLAEDKEAVETNNSNLSAYIGTVRESREEPNHNRFATVCFPNPAENLLKIPTGYFLRDFLCLRKSKQPETAKHPSASNF